MPYQDVVALQELKDAKTANGTHTVTLYAIPNISAPDWKTVNIRRGFRFARGPNDQARDNHVISRANTDPKTTVFVDDRWENVPQPNLWDSMA